MERVKPERDENSDKSRKEKWWLHARSNEKLRGAINNLRRYIVTVQTSKFRNFMFISGEIMPDDKLIAIGFDDAYYLGVLSSKIHVIWASAIGGRMGVGNDLVYDKNQCFEPFPFPVITEEIKEKIKSIAERLDSHRKQRQVLYPELTITEMYNVLEKLREGKTLNIKEQTLNEKGLINILLQIHYELDVEVSKAYGWPANLPIEEILENLVRLNKERILEESQGLIRWLRPEYQNPGGARQTELAVGVRSANTELVSNELTEWPKTLAEQAKAVQRIIQQYQRPVSAEIISKQFKMSKSAKKTAIDLRKYQIVQLLETISSLGLLRKTNEGLFVK